LINHYECHWYIFTNQLEDQEKLNENQKLSFYYFKDLNEKNIQSLHIKPIELLIMPKNKRLELLKIVESKIEDLTYGQIIIIDSYRTDPFQQDILFDYVINNSYFDNETKKIVLVTLLGFITYIVHGGLNDFLDTDKASVPFWGFIAMLVAIDLYHKHRGEETSTN
jgi:hypothetical protein